MVASTDTRGRPGILRFPECDGCGCVAVHIPESLQAGHRIAAPDQTRAWMKGQDPSERAGQTHHGLGSVEGTLLHLARSRSSLAGVSRSRLRRNGSPIELKAVRILPSYEGGCVAERRSWDDSAGPCVALLSRHAECSE